MPPIGRDIGKGNQNKGPILHPRMRQDQLGRRLDCLPRGIERKPAIKYGAVRQDAGADGDQVQIQCPRTPAHLTLAAVAGFNVVQNGQNFLGGHVRLQSHRRIYEVGAGAWRKSRGAIKAASANRTTYPLVYIDNGMYNGLFWTSTQRRNVSANSHQNHIDYI